MVDAIVDEQAGEMSPEAVREQLERLVRDAAFRSSKRSVQFLRFVVEQTLQGSSEQIKERTIGIEVFGRDPAYDTNLDHVVRTAAIELRKRLAIYYGREEHRGELRMSMVPGSYIPRFSAPTLVEAETLAVPSVPATEGTAHAPVRHRLWYAAAAAVLCVLLALAWGWLRPADSEDVFWKPVLDTPGAVLMAVGDVPNGPPTTVAADSPNGQGVPVIHKASSPVVPFADTVTIARVWGILAAHGKKVTIRPEGASSFSDLREGPVVLVGAFNNEWSLRFTQKQRYSLALDPEKHLIYIRDARNPDGREWSWHTDQPVAATSPSGHTQVQDYALISRIWNSETGHAVVSIGGLYTYGTEAAGEFLSDPQMMKALERSLPRDAPHKDVQIVLGATVTDGTPGPPRVLAVASN